MKRNILYVLIFIVIIFIVLILKSFIIDLIKYSNIELLTPLECSYNGETIISSNYIKNKNIIHFQYKNIDVPISNCIELNIL